MNHCFALCKAFKLYRGRIIFYNDINFKAVDMKKKARDSEFLGLANQCLILVKRFGLVQQLVHFIQCQVVTEVILREILSMWHIKVIDIGSS